MHDIKKGKGIRANFTACKLGSLVPRPSSSAGAAGVEESLGVYSYILICENNNNNNNKA